MAKSKRKRNPGGAAGMLIDAIEREGPSKREANLQELREQIDIQHYLGQTMHEIIYQEAYDYLTSK